MAHLVFVEDAQGDLLDLEVYCTDSCAKTSPLYAGWNGAQEISDLYAKCKNCGSAVYPGAW